MTHAADPPEWARTMNLPPKFILGTAQLGQVYGVTNPRRAIPPAEVMEILASAGRRGIDTLDTAIEYGDSHKLLGQAIQAGLFDHPRVISKIKFPEGPGLTQWGLSQVSRALEELKVERLEGLLLHDGKDFNRAEVWDLLLQLKERDWVRKVGVSVYVPHEITSCRYARLFELIQLPYNLLDHRWDEETWLSALDPARMPEIHVRSVFLQGLLLSDADAWPPTLRDQGDRVTRFMQSLSGQLESPALDCCLRYALATEWVNGIVVGVYQQEQLDQTLRAFRGGRLPKETYREIQSTRPHLEAKVLDPRKWGIA